MVDCSELIDAMRGFGVAPVEEKVVLLLIGRSGPIRLSAQQALGRTEHHRGEPV
jgi:hypothetical protein